MATEALRGTTLYLNAGGRGTRLDGFVPGDFEVGVIKALLTVGEPPIRLIDHHLNRAFFQGVGSIIVGLGDHAGHVIDQPGIRLPRYGAVARRNGTGGDLLLDVRRNRGDLGDTMLVHNIDTILHISDADLVAQHRRLGTAATIALTMRTGVPNQDAFMVDSGGMVVYSHEASRASRSLASADAQTSWRGSSVGAVVLSTEFLDELSWQPTDGEYSLYADILAVALRQRSLAAYDNGERFFLDVGTPETLQLARQSGSPVQPHLQYGDYDREAIAA